MLPKTNSGSREWRMGRFCTLFLKNKYNNCCLIVTFEFIVNRFKRFHNFSILVNKSMCQKTFYKLIMFF